MKIWIVEELDSLIPRSGAVVGVFTNEKLARDFIKEEQRNANISKIITLTGWDENEIIPDKRNKMKEDAARKEIKE